MLIIEIGKIPPEGTQYTGNEPAEILQADNATHFRAIGPVAFDLYVQAVSRELILRGKVSAPLELECARCADFFSTTLQDSSFLRAYEIEEETDSVDVTDDLREAVLLQMPAFPLCAPDCKGLCPQCGKNLNEGDCDCEKSDTSPKWKVLDELEI